MRKVSAGRLWDVRHCAGKAIGSPNNVTRGVYGKSVEKAMGNPSPRGCSKIASLEPIMQTSVHCTFISVNEYVFLCSCERAYVLILLVVLIVLLKSVFFGLC